MDVLMIEKDLLFERVLDLSEQVRLENNPRKITLLIQELNKVLVQSLELQSRERLANTLAKAATPEG